MIEFPEWPYDATLLLALYQVLGAIKGVSNFARLKVVIIYRNSGVTLLWKQSLCRDLERLLEGLTDSGKVTGRWLEALLECHVAMLNIDTKLLSNWEERKLNPPHMAWERLDVQFRSSEEIIDIGLEYDKGKKVWKSEVRRCIRRSENVTQDLAPVSDQLSGQFYLEA